MKRALQGLTLVTVIMALVTSPLLGQNPPRISPGPEIDPQDVFRSACDRLMALEAKHAALKGVSEVKPSLQLDENKRLKSANFVFERNTVPAGKDRKAKDGGKPFVYVSVSVWSGHSAQPPADLKTFKWLGQEYEAWVRVYSSDTALVNAIRGAIDEPILAPALKK